MSTSGSCEVRRSGVRPGPVEVTARGPGTQRVARAGLPAGEYEVSTSGVGVPTPAAKSARTTTHRWCGRRTPMILDGYRSNRPKTRTGAATTGSRTEANQSRVRSRLNPLFDYRREQWQPPTVAC